MNDQVFIRENLLWVSLDYLKMKGIPEKTLQNGKTNFEKGRSLSWEFSKSLSENNDIYISYKRIPQKTIKKYGLKSYAEIKADTELQIQESRKDKDVQRLGLAKLGLNSAYDSKWKQFFAFYNELPISKEQHQNLARTHAVFEEITQLVRCNYKIKDLFEIYQTFELVTFKTKNISSFYRKIELMQKESIAKNLTHAAFGRTKDNPKLSKLHKNRIKFHYSNPRKLSQRHITELVNKELIGKGFNEISLSTVKQFLRDPLIKNECAISRYGKKYLKEHLVPTMVRLNAKYAGDQWQIDGTRLQFLCNINGKPSFLYIVIVLDIHSGKVVGFSIDEHENTIMIMDALKRACIFCGHMPHEILHDNFSAYSTQEFRNLVQESSLLGVSWRTISLGNSGDNGYVERFFGTFQSVICKPIDGYIGAGIRSKGRDAHPSPELLKTYREKERIRTKEELIILFDSLIQKYNNEKMNGQNLSANLKYEVSEKPNIKALQPYQTAYLFWKTKRIKVNKSMIQFQVNKQNHTYTIWDLNTSKKINGTEVIVKYDNHDLSKIYVFDTSEKFINIFEEEPPIPIALANQTEENKKAIKAFVAKRNNFMNSIKQERIKEQLDIEEEFGEFPIEVIDPATSLKEVINAAETNYTISEYGIDVAKVEQLSSIRKRRNKIKKHRKTSVIKSVEEITLSVGPFYINGDLSIVSY